MRHNIYINRLTIEEKLQLIDDIWNTIDMPDELIPFNLEHKKLIDDRLSEIDENTKWITLTELKETLQLSLKFKIAELQIKEGKTLSHDKAYKKIMNSIK